MRAIGINAFGGSEVLVTLSADVPEPGSGEVRVKVACSGVNWVDVNVRRGVVARGPDSMPSWPTVLGYEGAGTIEAIGADVEGLEVGARVAWCGVPGAHAEFAVVPAWRVVPVPNRMPLDVACALQLDGIRAHALAVSVFPIRAGDRILIQSGADPWALLLTQIANAQGAEVTATVQSELEVGAPLSAGADNVIVLAEGRAREEIQVATRGQGCHVVYDAAGRAPLPLSVASCRRRGMLVLHDADAALPQGSGAVDVGTSGSLYLTQPDLVDFLQDATEVRWRTEGLFEAWSNCRLKVEIGRILPLEAAREGHLALETGTAAGKILLQIEMQS